MPGHVCKAGIELCALLSLLLYRHSLWYIAYQRQNWE